MIKIEKQAAAENDLESIWLYSFDNWGEAQADKYYDELIKGMDLIATYPDIGVSCEAIRAGYRCFKIKEHEVFYKRTATSIVIIRVLHESMKPSLHL